MAMMMMLKSTTTTSETQRVYSLHLTLQNAAFTRRRFLLKHRSLSFSSAQTLHDLLPPDRVREFDPHPNLYRDYDSDSKGIN